MPLKFRLLSSLINLPIPEEFKSITGFQLFTRKTNYLSDRTERKDSIFNQLAILYFFAPKKFNKLKRKIKGWLSKDQSETIFALAGYIYYITQDFNKAKKYFLRNIAINPDNLDNWTDLAFALRHNNEYKISNGMLFHHNFLVYYYKHLKLQGCSYSKLKQLVLEIIRHTDVI